MRTARWGLAVLTVIAASASGATGIYEFKSDQSRVVQTGGFAGVHETYRVEGVSS